MVNAFKIILLLFCTIFTIVMIIGLIKQIKQIKEQKKNKMKEQDNVNKSDTLADAVLNESESVEDNSDKGV